MIPWNENPDLTEDRVVAIANRLKDIRDETVFHLEGLEHVGPWGKGCMVYDRQITDLNLWADDVPWLEVVLDGMYFLMRVGNTPLKIYRGDSETPPDRTLHVNPHEQLMFETMHDTADNLIWRISTSTHPDQSTAQMVLGRYTQGGECLGTWVIPISDYENDYATEEPVQLPFEALSTTLTMRD
jgi:hypothetical protein